MKPFHLFAYSQSLGNVTNNQVDAPQDEVIQVRNTNPIYSEPYNVIAIAPNGANLTRMRFGNIALQYRGIQHFFPMIHQAAIPSRPEVSDYLERPIILPVNEEVVVEATTDAVGPQIINCFKWLTRPDWQPNVPFGEYLGWVRATVVIAAGAASLWGVSAPVVMERDLYNGVYAICGAHVITANANAFRFVFRTQADGGQRQHRPGGLTIAADGDVPWFRQSDGLGEWGRFATYELPNIQMFGDAVGGTYEVRLKLVYLGTDTGRLYV